MEDLSGANEIVERDLLAIRSRLVGIKTVRESVSQSGEQRLLQAVENRSTSAARSEFFAGSDELWKLTHDRVNEIHGFVLETGKKGKDFPDYEDMVSDNLWRPKELENRYWRKDGRVDVFADRDPGPLAEDEESRRKKNYIWRLLNPSALFLSASILRTIFLSR